MPKNKEPISTQPIKKLVNNKGFRISDSAAKKLTESMNKYLDRIIKEIKNIKSVSNSKTILERDVDLAIKILEDGL